MLSLSTRELLRRHALLDQLGNNQKLKLADEYINTGYNLVWNEGSYDKAIDALQKALDIQHECHGKHHKDVGHTCSFIGTAFLHKGEHGQALRYFLESRRIFCKAGQGRVKSVDRNIHYVLEKMGLCPKDIAWYQDSVRRVVEHELQADQGAQGHLRRQPGAAVQPAAAHGHAAAEPDRALVAAQLYLAE